MRGAVGLGRVGGVPLGLHWALQLLPGVPRFPNVDAATATVPLTSHVGV